MVRGKKIATFLLMTATFALLLFFYANDHVTDLIKSAVNGSGNAQYYELTAATDGSIWALGRRDGELVLAGGTLSGGEWRGKLNTGALPQQFLPDGICAVSKELALLTGYRLSKDGSPLELQLYAIKNQGKTLEPLLNRDITGSIAQGNNVRFSTFACYNEKVFFLISDGDTSYLYELSCRNTDMRMTGSFRCEPWNSALVLSDGKIAVARDEGIIAFYSNYGAHQYDLETSGSVSALYAGTDSFYYLDSVAKTVNEVGVQVDEYYIIRKIPADSALPLAVQPGGTTLWLENGKLYHYDGAPVQINGVLYRAARDGILILAGISAVIVLLALLSTVLLCGRRHISILLRSALVLFIALLLSSGIMRTFAFHESRQGALEIARQGVETAASLGLKLSDGRDGGELSADTVNLVLRSMSDSGFYDTRATLYRYIDDGFFVVTTSDPELENGTVVTGSGLMLNAKPSGTISALSESLSGPVCTAVASDGPELLSIRTNFSSVWEKGEAQAKKLSAYLSTALFVLACIVYFMILRYWSGIHRLTLGMNLVSSGEYDVELKNPSGDELESLTKSLNNMTQALKNSAEKEKEIAENYMRFVPEETIKLMGVERLEDVTRETVATHQMAVITVQILPPNENLSPEQLFSDLNMIVQRTSYAAVAYAGNSFNFAFSGYNVVFSEEFMDMSFHAALAIREAADAVNKERELAGRPPMHVTIAIDKGLVQMGIVGDELHMVPVVASGCLIKNQQMLRLCKPLNANILFSEAMMQEDNDCNFRYVGNFVMDNTTEKLYELYDSDSYLVAQRKRDTQEEFDQAIRCFYQYNFKAAKAILLQLVRTGSARDGSVCYYLNKADLYEQNPPKTLLLRGEEY